MSSTREEWPFLQEAWKYALILTGNESSALALLREAIDRVSRRTDAAELSGAQRLLFSHLFRCGSISPVVTEPATESEKAAAVFHRLPEPGRSALTLLCLGLFSGEHLAGLLGRSEKELADALGQARERFAPAS